MWFHLLLLLLLLFYLNTEVRHQAIKASRISGCLNETIWSNKYLRNEAKVRIYKSVVRPIPTYAAET